MAGVEQWNCAGAGCVAQVFFQTKIDHRPRRYLDAEIAERVAKLDANGLLEPFPGEDMPAVLRLLRMATHDIYHAGQIRHLRALPSA